jgi:hypothetical protein
LILPKNEPIRTHIDSLRKEETNWSRISWWCERSTRAIYFQASSRFFGWQLGLKPLNH